MTSLQFLGGADTVTGSKYLLETNGKRLLIDCGLFQGLKTLRLKNWEEFPLPPSEIDAIVLTHAHIDHSGYIPILIKNGFCGRIYCTSATQDLCKILLPDAGYLAQEEANFLNKHKKTKHSPALPLFTLADAQKSLSYFEPLGFKEVKTLSNDLSLEFRYAGHILGAASVVIKASGLTLGFTGDIGRPNNPIFFAPDPLPSVDYLITESTYGNRKHEQTHPKDELEKIISEAQKTKGVVIIPSFAVGRAQELMFYLWQLKKEGKLLNFPIFLNSPMATNVNSLFIKYHELHKLSEAESQEMCEAVRYINTVEESRALNERSGPMLIISASGMISGGRVLHHIKQFGPSDNNFIVLTGFQAAGTRGEALQNGVKEIKIHGEYIPIRAKIKTLSNTSAHADYAEIINWYKGNKLKPRSVFITHGEPSAADAMRVRLKDNFGWNCIIPSQNQKFELT